MLADRALLGVTLCATFLSGGLAGYVAGNRSPELPPPRLGKAEYVYARELREAERAGYTQAELDEWLDIHQDYVDAYQEWWAEFLDSYAENLDPHDRAYEERLEAFEARVAERLGREGGE